MKCPVCGSDRTYANFDTAAWVHGNTAVILMDCKECGSYWNAIFLHQYDEEIYDATADRYVTSSKKKAGIANTFFEDFTIADMFGKAAVQDTFDRAFGEWKDDYRYLTALVIALNHKIWQHYETNEELARLYNDLWMQADAYACDNLKDDELLYFYRETD